MGGQAQNIEKIELFWTFSFDDIKNKECSMNVK